MSEMVPFGGWLASGDLRAINWQVRHQERAHERLKNRVEIR